MNRNRSKVGVSRAAIFAVACGCIALVGFADARMATPESQSSITSRPDLSAFRWRSVGPSRGGRSIAVTGVSSRPNQYYFGATGGGLWKTDNGGMSWYPVGDGQFASSSVGAIDVCNADPDIVYIGFGEVQLRGNVIPGDGVYRTSDGGRTWVHLGLESSTGQQTIARLRVHPENCNTVYAAAFGDPFGPSAERGVFRTRDGGRTWQRVLFRSDRAGAVDLALSPSEPDTIYAAFWEAYRKPWLLWSGGEGSGLFKSTDGGDHWTELTHNPGLPTDLWGKVAIAVSGADANRLYANIEAHDGGLFSSDDAGATWTQVSADRNLRTRAFYYTRITADPVERDTIYVNNENFWRSRDGGRTWTRIRVPHDDNHDLWIDPANNQRMIQADDGGATISVDGGRTWTPERYPTAQMYTVSATTDFPYFICGTQQDEGSGLCVPSDGDGSWWIDVGGGESGWVVPDPEIPTLIYAGSQTSALTRFDRATGQSRSISPWPIRTVGRSAEDVEERFQWTYPIAVSHVPPYALFVGSQHLWRSTDKGMSWERISPDLTYADPKTLGPSGGPITLDRTTVEHYATIFAIAPSPRDANTIWVGSDDGLVHLTRDGGKTWQNVTPPAVSKFSRINFIHASKHEPGKALIAVGRYRMQDVNPYLWKTENYGKSWSKIVTGIRPGGHLRTVIEDPEREGLLFAGTENGVYMSSDDGATWTSLQLNLPVSPVYSLAIHGDDLLAATHGRSFWVLDDISPLRQMTPDLTETPAQLFRPARVIRNNARAIGYRRSPAADGANIYYYLRTAARSASLEILDARGSLVRRWTTQTVDGAPKEAATTVNLPLEPGLNVLHWDLRYPGPVRFPGLLLRFSRGNGPLAPPGTYQVRLKIDDQPPMIEQLTIDKDPRLNNVTSEDFQAQFQLAMKACEATSKAHATVIRIRDLASQVDGRLAKTKSEALHKAADAFKAAIQEIEGQLYEVRLRAPEDQLNYGLKLNNDLAVLQLEVETGDGRPTAQQYAVFEELSRRLRAQLDALEKVLADQLPHLNELLERESLKPVQPTSDPRA